MTGFKLIHQSLSITLHKSGTGNEYNFRLGRFTEVPIEEDIEYFRKFPKRYEEEAGVVKKTVEKTVEKVKKVGRPKKEIKEEE